MTKGLKNIHAIFFEDFELVFGAAYKKNLQFIIERRQELIRSD
jgi:hypothetical protein